MVPELGEIQARGYTHVELEWIDVCLRLLPRGVGVNWGRWAIGMVRFWAAGLVGPGRRSEMVSGMESSLAGQI